MAAETQHPQTDLNPSFSTLSSDSQNAFLKVQDISQKAGLPPHLQYLMTLKGDQDFISIHEWAARLCHALMVEAGFFPAFNGHPDISAINAVDMPENLRIPYFVKQLPTNCIYSEQGIYALKYQAILSELVEITEKSEINDAIPIGTESADDPPPSKEQEAIQPQEWRYYFSNDINLTINIMEDRLTLTAVYNPGNGLRSMSHQLSINIEEFLVVKVRMVPVRLRPDQWIRKFDLNSTRFAGYFKNKFAIHLLDQMDAVVFERRGLISLPYLVLIKILKMSTIENVLHVSRTCLYMHNVVKDNRLWKYFLNRDFPNESLVINPPAISSTQGKTEHTVNNSPDFYEIYKQKYLSKYRRIHRFNSFPLRVSPNLQIGRRFRNLPFPFDHF